MKTKILLSFAILVCAAITSHAQINEGRYLLGGSIGFSSSKSQQSPEDKNESFNTIIQFGKVIKDNNVAGIILSYGYSHNVSVYKTNQYGAGVFYRKYKSIAKNFYLFGEADAVYNYLKSTSGDFQVGNDATGFTSNSGILSLTPGISYSICKRMQMALVMQNLVSLSYGVSKNEATSTGTSTITSVKSHNFSANINVDSGVLNNWVIGFKFFLGK